MFKIVLPSGATLRYGSLQFDASPDTITGIKHWEDFRSIILKKRMGRMGAMAHHPEFFLGWTESNGIIRSRSRGAREKCVAARLVVRICVCIRAI